MAAPALTLAQIRDLRPCSGALTAVTRMLGDRATPITAAEARAAGVSFDHLVWVASAAALPTPDVGRRLRLWMADCAARVLSIYEHDYPSDGRVRAAIVAARQYARGEIGAAARAAARAAAWDAARDAARAAAMDAARAAARAAAWDAAWDAAWAAARDAAGAAARAAARDAEEAWQFDRLVLWLSDPEPEDWPLDAPARAGEAA